MIELMPGYRRVARRTRADGRAQGRSGPGCRSHRAGMGPAGSGTAGFARSERMDAVLVRQLEGEERDAGRPAHQPRRHRARPVRRLRAQDGGELRGAGQRNARVPRHDHGEEGDRPVLRRHGLPPRHRRLHDPGRRSHGHWSRRPRLPLRRRVLPRPHLHQALSARHGERGPGHQRLAVLHHGGPHPAPQHAPHDLRRGRRRGLEEGRRRDRRRGDRPDGPSRRGRRHRQGRDHLSPRHRDGAAMSGRSALGRALLGVLAVIHIKSCSHNYP